MKWLGATAVGVMVFALGGATVALWAELDDQEGDHPDLRGSGGVVTEVRAVEGFDAIELAGTGTVRITQGASEEVTVETDDNIVPYVSTEVHGGTLLIRFTDEAKRWTLRPTRLVYDVALERLTAITISGAGSVEANGITADRLDVSISGAGTLALRGLTATDLRFRGAGTSDVTVAGAVGTQDIELNGTGSYRASDLACDEARVVLNGVGTIAVHVRDRLDVAIHGSGNVEYRGTPVVKQQVTGFGSVTKVDDGA